MTQLVSRTLLPRHLVHIKAVTFVFLCIMASVMSKTRRTLVFSFSFFFNISCGSLKSQADMFSLDSQPEF